MTRYKFITQVVFGLAKDALEIRETPPGPSSSITTIQIPDNKERECSVCSDPKGAGRKHLRIMCSVARKGYMGHVCTSTMANFNNVDTIDMNMEVTSPERAPLPNLTVQEEEDLLKDSPVTESTQVPEATPKPGSVVKELPCPVCQELEPRCAFEAHLPAAFKPQPFDRHLGLEIKEILMWLCTSLKCRDEEELCRSLNGTRAFAIPCPSIMPNFKALACDFSSFRERPQIGSQDWSVDPPRHPAMLMHWRVLSAVLARLSADDQAAFISKYGPGAPRGTFRIQPPTVVSRRSNTKGGEKPRSLSGRPAAAAKAHAERFGATPAVSWATPGGSAEEHVARSPLAKTGSQHRRCLVPLKISIETSATNC
ncbi:hypothetical protein ElyMa_006717500 [Elysia marginata]|uniref:Uncharacterized protein n=1 Tax=Elysia marginata TaxID=1093978 RepID=A0AAV4IRU3_9GAST|nr:hypothetical protein ElyMa_006717500 [Elysia marginata]